MRAESRNPIGADSQGRCSASSSGCDCREDPMKQLIVNADDFGLTKNVNRGILDAHREGIVTSTTLLANGMAFESAVAAGKRFYRLGIGVGPNITQGEPGADAR